MKNGSQPFFVRRPRWIAFVGAFLIGLVLVFNRPIRQGAFTILRLPLTVTRSIVSSLVWLPRLPSLARENSQLRSELTLRELETAQWREGLRHSQQAQALIQATQAHHGTVASVIGRAPLPTQQTVLLDEGSRRGLSLESIIIDAKGVIGRVAEVHLDTAHVLLLTDPESRVAGLVERSRETGLLVGRGRGQCELLYLDLQADVQAGDHVVTAGLGGPFPKGLSLGTVARVVRDEQTGAASAWVEPAARLGRLEEVLALPSE